MSSPLSPNDPASEPPAPETPARGSALRWFWAGFRHAAQLPMFVMALTFLGIGSLAREAGVSLGVTMTATFFIWAGPAQVIFLGAVMAGAPLVMIALSVSLSSVRLLPMCVSLLPLLRPDAPRGPRAFALTLYTVHQIAVTGWAESIRRLPDMERAARLPWFMGLVHGLYLAAALASVVGYMLSATLPRELAAGLLFVTPIYFTAALLRNVREPIDWLALAFGFALTPALKPFVGAGFDLLIVGLVGGTLAWAAQRAINARRRRGEPAR